MSSAALLPAAPYAASRLHHSRTQPQLVQRHHEYHGNNGRREARTTTGMRRSSSSHGLHMAHLSASSSSDGSVANKNHRIVLQRPDDGHGLGFTIRGGVEHGVGHFVSSVEPGSEAHLQGLRPGDQILRLDGMLLRGLTHREAVALISARWRLTLEVRTRGVIPVKNRKGDPVTWRSVERSHPEPPDLTHIKQSASDRLETRVVINIAGSQGLGCSICKGPANKPGIFIQSTKPGGLARDAGLRPGDQILDCNGISFQHLEFTEAVYQLKSSRHLDLLLSKGAGADLFPSESSGYDSSSSSSAGHLCERHQQHRLYRGSRDLISPVRSSSPEVAKNLSLSKRSADVTGTRLKLEERLIEEERKKIEEEHERLKREAIKLEAEKKRLEEEKQNLTILAASQKSPVRSGTALKSAIQGELARRASKQTQKAAPPAPPPPPPSAGGTLSSAPTGLLQTASPGSGAGKKKKTPVDNLKNDQHDALMAEFKRAHKKMFNSTSSEDDEDEKSKPVSGARLAPAPGKDSDDSTAEQEVDKEEFVDDGTVETGGGKDEDEDPLNTTIGSCSSCTVTCTDSECSCSCTSCHASAEEADTSAKAGDSNDTASPGSKLRKPSKSPPPPPERTSSVLSAADGKPASKKMATFKPNNARRAAGKPGIPAPDYDSTPERSPKSNPRRTKYRSTGGAGGALRLSSSMSSLVVPDHPKSSSKHSSATPPSVKSGRGGSALVKKQPAFARRHPEVEVGSLDSFSIDTGGKDASQPKPPPYYYEPSGKHSPLVSISSYGERSDGSKSVRFNMSEETRLASKDYRVLSNSSCPSSSHSSDEESRKQAQLLKQKQGISRLSAAIGAGGDRRPRTKAPAPQPPIPAKIEVTPEVRV